MSTCRSQSYQSTGPSLADLNREKQQLIEFSMAKSSWKTYKTAVESFESFRNSFNLASIWPAPVEHITQFIAFLSYKGSPSSTVSTYLSGLSHEHKMKNIIDNTKSFIISKMIEGLKRKRPQKPDIRCPITVDLLKRLILALKSICSSQYEAVMFSAAFSLAYFAMLRVSEITINSKTDTIGHALNFNDVNFDNIDNPNELQVKIMSSKTDQSGKSVTLLLSKQSDRIICPLQLLKSYFHVRINSVGNSKLFVHLNGSALTKYQFCSMLQKSLEFCEISGHIRSHSFRIGRASDLAKNNVSEDEIKTCGRWNSSAYRSYIRLS